jgi:hypothetical protein
VADSNTRTAPARQQTKQAVEKGSLVLFLWKVRLFVCLFAADLVALGEMIATLIAMPQFPSSSLFCCARAAGVVLDRHGIDRSIHPSIDHHFRRTTALPFLSANKL